MSGNPSFLKKLFSGQKAEPIDRYDVVTVSNPAELASADTLPAEIRYVLAVRPSRFENFRKLLERGYGIGVRRVEKTPEMILRAVDRISRSTQHNTVVPWLEDLLRTEKLPVFTAAELEEAERKGIRLYEEVRMIVEHRFEFRKIVIIDLKNQGIGEEDRKCMHEVNEDLFPLSIDAIVHRVTFDNAHTRTEVAQSIIKALIFIGPIAHGLEHVLSGLGKVFAASMDDLLSEVAELFALHGSGFTWRQLARRSRILVPVFILATYGAFQVEPLIVSGRIGTAGVVFGLSAVALSLVTAIQSIFLYRKSYVDLAKEGKISLKPGQTITGLALRQDFTNPARLGLFVGAVASPIVAATVFSLFPALTKNGWILAILGSTESIVAGATVIAGAALERRFFRRKVDLALKAIVRRG